ncbi:MAG: hypothetical protein JST20_04290 [Bacteroidetes bacterium]|nr:hypothetical protein [Bacteroidota bacterium]
MPTDNNFSMDTYSKRRERLMHIQMNFATHAEAFASMPSDVAEWAISCDSVLRERKFIREGPSKGATTSVKMAFELLKKEYGIVRRLAETVFVDSPFLFNGYNFHLIYPTTQSAQIGRVQGVLDQNQRMKDGGQTPVLQDMIINRLSAALDSAKQALTKRADAHGETKYLQKLLDERWDFDTKKLQTLYSWSIAVWDDNHINLIDFGFARTEQYDKRGRPSNRRVKNRLEREAANDEQNTPDSPTDEPM